MATRSLTSRYNQFRSELSFRSTAVNSPTASRSESHSVSDAGLLTSSDIQLNHPVLPPQWVDILDVIKKDMNKVKDNLRALKILHDKRVKVAFSEEEIKDQDAEIEILTQAITRLLRASESNVKRIAGSTPGERLSDAERSSRLNVMRAIAQDLAEQSRIFRKMQKDFLHSLREQASLSENFGFTSEEDARSAATLEEAIDQGLTSEQLEQMQQLADRSDHRYADIINIAQSINELASLFQELNVLVIEQGSLLDRIDYNIEQTAEHTEKGKKELVAADVYSKRSITMKCICVLLIIVIILLIVLIWKKSK